MALLNILHYPDSRLFNVAKPVDIFDAHLHKLVADMAETMYAALGIGLAAPQIDVHKQIIVIDISDAKNALCVFINSEIIWTSKEKNIYNEGCLSVPGIYNNVERPAEVEIRAYNLQGRVFEFKTNGLLATCIQHEIDHLHGKVFLEYLSPLKQNRIKIKFRKDMQKNKHQKIILI